MKFQLKALVAALALVAAVPAQAALDATTTGSSSMVLAVFDREAGASGLFDLGINYADFNKLETGLIVTGGASFADSNVDALGTSFSWNLTQGDYAGAWNALLPLVNPSRLQWAVIATDSNSTSGRGTISTLNGSLESMTNSQLANQAGNLNNFFVSATTGQAFQNHDTASAGANAGNSTIAFENFYNYFGTDKNSGLGSISVGNIDSSLGVYQQITNGASGDPALGLVFGNNARFQLTANGALSYSTDSAVAPIPEADSWAMMVLGFGLMGFAARRRQQA